MQVLEDQQSRDVLNGADQGARPHTLNQLETIELLRKAAGAMDHNRLFNSVCDFDFDIRNLWDGFKRYTIENGGIKPVHVDGYIERLNEFREYLHEDVNRELAKVSAPGPHSGLSRHFQWTVRSDLISPLEEVISYLERFKNHGGQLVELRQINPHTWFTGKNYDQVLLGAIDKVASHMDSRAPDMTDTRQAA